jgi:hypothetical protein
LSAGESTLVELAPGAVPSAVWRDMLTGGWPISEITRQHTDVEAMYFDLTQPRREDGVA